MEAAFAFLLTAVGGLIVAGSAVMIIFTLIVIVALAFIGRFIRKEFKK